LPRGKGQREFLAAAARIAGEVPKARFLVIGRGNLKDALEADIEMLGLRKRAWLTPYSHDMPAAMNAIDCLVHPQVGTESWGSVVCEAHACGKPVIASNLDGIPEAFAAAGYGELVEPDSVEALAVAMRRWAARAPLDLEARWKLHAKVATRFSLERAAQELAEIYRTVVEGDGRAK
jgi:glycosyltransferase involved in cell wall biosynthesis